MHVAAYNLSRCVPFTVRASAWAPISAECGSSKKHLPIRKYSLLHKSSTSHITGLETSTSQSPVRRPLRITRGTSKPIEDIPYARFAELIKEQWVDLRIYLKHSPAAASEFRSWGVTNKSDRDKWITKFHKKLKQKCQAAIELHSTGNDPPMLIQRLRKAFIVRDINGLASALKFSLEMFVLNKGFSKVTIENQRMLADFRHPIEWFPGARAIQRKIHLHVGPTNSGKTYQALQRLESADSGVYAGPLRLLAHEVYTRLNAKNKLCALITGEERRIPEGGESYLTSCTVEMVPLNTMVDVAVIDEIQMMGDSNRGWAWTQAFLGVKAKEVHLCGEMRTVPLIQQLCAMTGDSLEIHKYERLSPLEAMKSSLKGDLRNLEKGDAVILFSRLSIHSMKKEIEKVTGKRCAVVYGSLPPETRAQQASLFNNPDNEYDFLVASDAVGMGLNLSIKRVIFETTSKMDETGFRTLHISEIKQIAGRAGRFRTVAQAVEDSISPRQEDSPQHLIDLNNSQTNSPGTIGLVTTLQDYDMPILQKAMSSEAPPLATAGIQALDDIILRFAPYFPESTPLSSILLRLYEISTVNPRFHLCHLRDQLQIADAIQEYDLTIDDRVIFINAPVNLRQRGIEAVVKALAKCIADQSGGELLDIKEINLDLLDSPMDVESKEYLRELENLHSSLTLYLWLSYRFAGVFGSQALAFHVKSLLEDKIEACLSNAQMDPQRKRFMSFLQRQAAFSSQAAKGDRSHIDPIKTLPEVSEMRNATVSAPKYVDFGLPIRADTWLGKASVMNEGKDVRETAIGSTKIETRRNAAKVVLTKVFSDESEPASHSLPMHDVSESRLVLPSSLKENIEINVPSEGVLEREVEKLSTVG